MKPLLGTLLRQLASWEFECSPNRPFGFFRRAYLQAMQVKHGDLISFGTEIYIRNCGNLTLGECCAIGSFTRIWNYALIDIGDDFLSAGGLTLNSATHDPITLEPYGAPIRIGHRVWCGVNVTILAGVTIGDDVIVGAGSVVVNDIPSNSVAAGVPARSIKPLIREQLPVHPLRQDST